MGFLREAFSENGIPSSSRLLTVPNCFAAIFILGYVAIKTHSYPDATTWAGAGAFATVFYAVNRATTAWGKDRIEGNDNKQQINN